MPPSRCGPATRAMAAPVICCTPELSHPWDQVDRVCQSESRGSASNLTVACHPLPGCAHFANLGRATTTTAAAGGDMAGEPLLVALGRMAAVYNNATADKQVRVQQVGGAVME